MVQITKNGIVLLIPRTAYEADYKNYGWKIVGAKQEPKKEIVSPTAHINNEKNENKVIDSKKNKEK